MGLFVIPVRLKYVMKNVWAALQMNLRWLVCTREFTNFTYEISDLNKTYLAWFVSSVCDIPFTAAYEYISELNDESSLSQVLDQSHHKSRRLNEFHDGSNWGRRLGWYAIVRATKPKIVVETGTDKGLGSLAILRALQKNGTGHLFTIDIDPSAGLLLVGEDSNSFTKITANSLDVLAQIKGIDMFIHDSDHSSEHEALEYLAVTGSLSPSSIVLSDNAHGNNELAMWSDLHHRQFSFWQEKPIGHWYAGAGIGASIRKKK